jgi:DNA-binding transcriptional ArsR family regulator
MDRDTEVAELLKGLTAGIRLKILRHLAAGPATRSELAEACEIHRDSIMHHLNDLIKRRAVERDPDAEGDAHLFRIRGRWLEELKADLAWILNPATPNGRPLIDVLTEDEPATSVFPPGVSYPVAGVEYQVAESEPPPLRVVPVRKLVCCQECKRPFPVAERCPACTLCPDCCSCDGDDDTHDFPDPDPDRMPQAVPSRDDDSYDEDDDGDAPW